MKPILCLLLIFFFSGLLFTINISAQMEAVMLEVGKPIENELKGGEAHNYRIALAAGQFLDIVTTQRGIDVVVKLFAPNGEQILYVDNPNGSNGQEPLWFISQTEGNYRIEIAPLEKDAGAGHYEIKINEIRVATPDDNLLVEGQKAKAEGDLLIGERNQVSTSKAFEKYEEAAKLFRLMKDQKKKASLIYQLGNYDSNENFEKAIEYFKEALELYESLDLKQNAIGVLLDIGVVYEDHFKYTDALDAYQKALAIAVAINDKKLQARTYNQFGRVYSLLGDNNQTLKYFKQALKLSEGTNWTDDIWVTLLGLGNVYQALGDNARALEYQQKNLTLLETLGKKGRISAQLLNIGNTYQNQANYEQALEYFQKSLAGFEAQKSPVGISFALSNIGEVYMFQGKYAEALIYLEKSRQMKTAFTPKDPNSLVSIGMVYKYQGKYPEALAYIQKGIDLFPETGDLRGLAGAMKEVAAIYYLQGDYAKSLEFAGKAAVLAEQFNYPKIYWHSLTTVASTRLALGQKKEAREALESAIGKIERLRTQAFGGESQRQDFFKSMTGPYQMLVDLSVSEDKIPEAFAYAERFKARALLDVLQTGKIDVTKAMTVQEREQERKFKNEIASFNMQISGEENKIQLSDLQRQLEKKRLEFEDFQVRLYAAHPELRVQRGEIKSISLENAAKLLPNEKNAMLEYVIADDKAFLFVITKEAKQSQVSLKSYPIYIKQKNLAQKIEDFRSKLAGGDLDFARNSQDLYNLLLKPAEAQIKNKTNLIIVPDSILWDLPFQALQPMPGKYLVEQTAISYAPSLTALREMVKKNQGKQTSNTTLLAFGNPLVNKETSERIKQVFMGEKLESIPEAERLVNSLQKMYGANRSKVFVGKEAREETAKTETPRYRIVQFAAHGILNNINPMYSHIVLSQKTDNPDEDGLLEAWEMKDLDLQADMVILSACETARGKLSSGEGVIGMSWALFIAGAPTTVASQWKVESKSTTELMLEFHRQLLNTKGISKAEALRRAELKLLKTQDYKHPSYWAGFVIVGDGF